MAASALFGSVRLYENGTASLMPVSCTLLCMALKSFITKLHVTGAIITLPAKSVTPPSVMVSVLPMSDDSCSKL